MTRNSIESYETGSIDSRARTFGSRRTDLFFQHAARQLAYTKTSKDGNTVQLSAKYDGTSDRDEHKYMAQGKQGHQWSQDLVI